MRRQAPIDVEGEHFLAITAGRTLDLSLPRPSVTDDKKRFYLKGVLDGLYLASERKTAICEVWDAQNQSLRLDLYSIKVHAEKILDLRPPQIQADFQLSSDCFGLANPPDRQDRNYIAWQHLAYAIWSAGFNGVIWKSQRYAGDSLCIYFLGEKSSLSDAQSVESYIEVRDWLKQHTS